MVPAGEYTLHRWDLEQALDNNDYTLPDDAAAVVLPLFGTLLPILAGAGRRPADPMSIAFQSPLFGFGVAYDGFSWSTTTGDEADCWVAGARSDPLLLVSGRRAISEGTLSATGTRADEAANLHDFFPTP